MKNLFEKMFNKKEGKNETAGSLGQENKKIEVEGISEDEIFQEAVKIVDKEKSGNPQEKYRPGAILEQSAKDEDYGKSVMEEAKKRLESPEFREKIIRDIKTMRGEHFGAPSLEHKDPEAYKKQKEEGLKEEDEMK